jgi:metallo-beta-lactamase class B
MSLSLSLALSAAVLAPQANADWTRPIEPFQIADNLYWVGSADLGSYLFTSDAGHILLDVPLEENVGMIVENIRQVGFDPSDVEIIIASHSHFDHVGGLALMRAITGATVILSAADADIVARGGVGPTGAGGYAPIHADRFIDHRGTVRLGGWTLTAQLTPGHTPGCTSWSGNATIEGAPVSFAFVCSLSVLGGYQLLGPGATFPGMGAAYCRSLATLQALTPDIFLAPHAGFIDLDEKLAALARGDRRAFVDPEGYRTYLGSAAAGIERRLNEEGHTTGCATLTASPGV